MAAVHILGSQCFVCGCRTTCETGRHDTACCKHCIDLVGLAIGHALQTTVDRCGGFGLPTYPGLLDSNQFPWGSLCLDPKQCGVGRRRLRKDSALRDIRADIDQSVYRLLSLETMPSGFIEYRPRSSGSLINPLSGIRRWSDCPAEPGVLCFL